MLVSIVEFGMATLIALVKSRIAVGIVGTLGLMWFAGCSRRPTRLEFLRMESVALNCYCASNAPTAEAALVHLAQCARQCQNARVSGIQYDEVLSRAYGRLYLIERRLGHAKEAKQYLNAYLQASSRGMARGLGLAHAGTETTMARTLDEGLRPAWADRP